MRVLEPEKFGLVSFGQSLMTYFSLVVNYGFNWSATRRIAIQQNNLEEIKKIAINVWVSKALLCLASFVVLIILMVLIPKLGANYKLLLILFGIVLGNLLFPVWLLQGLEKLVSLSVINFIMRLLITIGIFVVIKSPSDYLKYATLLSLQWIGAGIIGILLLQNILKLRFYFSGFKSIQYEMKDGWSLFMSTGAVSLYTSGNPFLLGLLTNDATVGYFTAADKLVRAAQGLLGPISQAFFPRLSYIASNSKDNALLWGKKILQIMGSVGIGMSMFIFFGAEYIVGIILGKGYENSISVIRILAMIPALVAISNVLGIQIMLPFRLDKKFTNILISAGFFNLIFAITFVSLWNESGMALAVCLSEAFVTCSMFIYLWKIKLNPLLIRNK